MSPPLSLSITPRKATWVAGEGILLDISHVVHADLDMETVELNRARTVLFITSLTDPAMKEALTGEDHARLHRISTLQPIGASFHATAGSTFESYLELLNYRTPLPAGRYRLSLRYAHGATPDEAVESNEVEVEVVPQTTLSLRHLWMSGGNPREELASAWVVRALAGSVHWLYRTARKHDPSVAMLATEIEGPSPYSSPPVLAHLNDIAPMHFLRHLVWVDQTTLGFRKIHAYGAASGALAVGTGLLPQPQPILVEPPLHRRDDSLAAVVLGQSPAGQLALACIDQPVQGAAQWKLVPLPQEPVKEAVVVWDGEETSFRGRAILGIATSDGKTRIVAVDLSTGSPSELLSAPEELVCLRVDQGLAMGRLFVLCRGQDAFLVKAFDIGTLALVAESSFPFEALGLGEAPAPPEDAVARAGEPALSLLFRGAKGHVVAHPGGVVQVSFDEVPEDAGPRLVSTPRRGVFLVFPDATTGVKAVRVEP